MAKNGNSNATSILLSFLAGGLMGFGLGLLFAPLSGRETRERIQDASQDVKERTIETASKTREKVEDLIEHGKEAVSEAKGGVRAAVETGMDTFRRTKSELVSGIKSDSSEES
jgi:gas vesicle protein